MKRVLIASWVPRYNRQGADLYEAICRTGDYARLWQVREDRAFVGGRLSGLKKASERLRLTWNIIIGRFDVVVLIGRPALCLAFFCKRFFRMRVVYYSLEYGKFSSKERLWLTSFVDGVLDVEENRLRQLTADNSLVMPGFVVNNMPHLHADPQGGKLKEYLSANFGISYESKIVVYAGSYQKYIRLENIIAAAAQMEDECLFVLMMYGVPCRLAKSLPQNVKVISPVSGDDFYSWLRDADCSLLPYESEDDFNVKYCSPQKIFDCYLVGVPYLASRRPIIEKTLQMESLAGCVCSFDDVEQIVLGIRTLLRRDKKRVHDVMRHLHETKLNYGVVEKDVVRFCYGV